MGLPQAIKPPGLSTPSPFPGGLLSYPFFAYHDPGARLFPVSWFAPSMAVAEALRAHCRFELALKWYQRAFDPLQQDCTWMICPGTSGEASPTQDQIAIEAYQIWEQHGHPPAEQNQDWFEAEKELKSHSAVVGEPADFETKEAHAVTARKSQTNRPCTAL